MTEFQKKLKKAIDAGVEIKQISGYCQCAPGSVSRWINGYSKPGNQKQIIKWLDRRIKYFEKIKKNIEGIKKSAGGK